MMIKDVIVREERKRRMTTNTTNYHIMMTMPVTTTNTMKELRKLSKRTTSMNFLNLTKEGGRITTTKITTRASLLFQTQHGPMLF